MTTSEPDAVNCYLYAVARPGAEPFAQGLNGVEGRTVRTVASGDLLAVVSDVPARDFSEQALRTRLEDLPRLEALARAHHAVVDALAARTAVLPVRLATLYRDERRVGEVLLERRREFESALTRLANHKEWGVKVFTTEPAPDTAAPSPSPSPSPSPFSSPSPAAAAPGPRNGGTSGRDYLRQRQRQRRQREDGRRRASDLGLRIDAELAALGDEVRHHRPQDPRLSGVRGENVLNAAYLVAHDREEEFTAKVAQMGERDPDVRVELTGPWAPYSFTSLDPAGEPARGGGEP